MRCIICEKYEWLSLFKAKDRMYGLEGKFTEYKCANCGLMRVHPKLSKKRLKKYYPPTKYYSYFANLKQGFFGKLRKYLVLHHFNKTCISRILETMIRVPALPSQPSGKILDIGCGSGETLQLLQASGWECYGLDVDEQAIKVAHKKGLVHVTFGSYETMKRYPNKYFDAIRLYHVIEHISDPVDCLKIAYDKLKTGGEIIIGTPNGESVIAHLAKQYWYNLDCPRHLFLFTPITLGHLMHVIGYVKPRIIFCSAGGWVGSIQYMFEEKWSKKFDFINNFLLILLIYPIEWLLDKIHLGDVFEIRGSK